MAIICYISFFSLYTSYATFTCISYQRSFIPYYAFHNNVIIGFVSKHAEERCKENICYLSFSLFTCYSHTLNLDYFFSFSLWLLVFSHFCEHFALLLNAFIDHLLTTVSYYPSLFGIVVSRHSYWHRHGARRVVARAHRQVRTRRSQTRAPDRVRTGNSQLSAEWADMVGLIIVLTCKEDRKR